jgi:hypothetical protein
MFSAGIFIKDKSLKFGFVLFRLKPKFGLPDFGMLNISASRNRTIPLVGRRNTQWKNHF